ncbi:MAG TPA: MtrAB system histidine kinase MtrB [Microbacteriaceae bacterium]|nr:MtrAB system histidine kinase MtrB [Microbacteriaceae bacterium]
MRALLLASSKPRLFLKELTRIWRRSLKVRLMTITAIITGVMILIAGVFVLTSVGEDLYSQRLEGALQDSARATLQAQQVIDVVAGSDVRSLNAAVYSMRGTVMSVSSSDYLVFKRQIEQPRFIDAPQDIIVGLEFAEQVSEPLTKALLSAESLQYWQPISFKGENGSEVPGIAVGTSINMPSGAGTYDLILGYKLEDTQKTYSFILRILLLTAIFLMLLIGGLVYGISRIVFRPIRVAAATSRRIAMGESDARMPLQNDEYFDMLSENFNQMADALQSRIDELDTLSEMQQRFVSDVSHELRTPLTTVKLATQVLTTKNQDLEPSSARAMEVMVEQVDRFEALLTDLLEISRYDAGRVSITTEPTNIVHLVEEVVENLQPLTNQVIEVRPVGGYNPIDVDPRRIRRIISNLIGNAIEHGEDKPIVVRIDSNSTAVAVSVRDYGVGMSEEDLTHVFNRFWRADPSRKRTLGGTGLGLAIAREDAIVHGGLLEVWSKPGRGTNFRVSIPTSEDEMSFFSPLPLVPEGESGEQQSPDETGGWLKRPRRYLQKAKKIVNQKTGEAKNEKS